ncbi:MAG: 23S rRNA (pseudouridine(1915)-N(3))-methyltransferase RlmH [Proteobacteria bacterium]|nr:MAG: 23S rRNA (pseudouridine(1915)-N(3))-methyltransferase RlmH [Pseudomonadota bacterium]
MQIFLLAVGNKMPAWVKQAYDEYANRMPSHCKLVLKEIPPEKRGKHSKAREIQEKEAEKIRQALPANCRIVALDGLGKIWSTEQLAERLEDWMMQGPDVALIIGGPDGLTREFIQQVDEHWSLSNLTFPHPMVRVIVAEQLYRAWTITENHPYHRAG